jgi:hypothetical protein
MAQGLERDDIRVHTAAAFPNPDPGWDSKNYAYSPNWDTQLDVKKKLISMLNPDDERQQHGIPDPS